MRTVKRGIVLRCSARLSLHKLCRVFPGRLRHAVHSPPYFAATGGRISTFSDVYFGSSAYRFRRRFTRCVFERATTVDHRPFPSWLPRAIGLIAVSWWFISDADGCRVVPRSDLRAHATLTGTLGISFCRLPGVPEKGRFSTTARCIGSLPVLPISADMQRCSERGLRNGLAATLYAFCRFPGLPLRYAPFVALWWRRAGRCALWGGFISDCASCLSRIRSVFTCRFATLSVWRTLRASWITDDSVLFSAAAVAGISVWDGLLPSYYYSHFPRLFGSFPVGLCSLSILLELVTACAYHWCGGRTCLPFSTANVVRFGLSAALYACAGGSCLFPSVPSSATRSCYSSSTGHSPDFCAVPLRVALFTGGTGFATDMVWFAVRFGCACGRLALAVSGLLLPWTAPCVRTAGSPPTARLLQHLRAPLWDGLRASGLLRYHLPAYKTWFVSAAYVSRDRAALRLCHYPCYYAHRR